jgi:hypothetical protein
MVWLLLVAALMGAGDADAQQTTDEPSVVSLDHIRKALKEPPHIRLEPREPTFRVSADERTRFVRVPERKEPAVMRPVGGLYAFEQRRQIGNALVVGSEPLVKIDVLPLADKAVRAVSSGHRRHLERTARDDAERALATFCALNVCERATQESQGNSGR